MDVPTADPIAQGAILLAQGDIAAAEGIAELRLRRGDDPDSLHLLALVRVRQNRLEEATSLLRRALTLQPGQPEILFNLGRLLAMLNRDTEAQNAFESAALAQPNFVEAWYALGDVQQRIGEIGKAETSFRKVLALEPQHAFAKLSLGVVLKDTERAQQSEVLLAEGLAETKDGLLQASFAYNLAFAQYDQGKIDAALNSFTLVRGLDPGRSSNVDLNRANILCELSRFEEAQTLLKDLLQREPLNDQAHIAYNRLLYSLRREEDFLKSFDLAPANTRLQMSKATLLTPAGRTEEALEIYAGILAREPDNQDAVTGMAAVLSKLGRHGEAVLRLEQALIRAPDNSLLFAGIANAALQGRNPEKAAAMAEKALARAPHDQLVLALLGSAWRLMGDERDEILNGYDDLIQVFDLDPPEGFSDMSRFNAALNDWLTGLHHSNREPINQSLRAGSQSWGKIFGVGHDLVERVKERIVGAMDRYIAGIKPQHDHPFRGRRANDFRFQGSWSSRLSDRGYHVNHVHPFGWISSCYYVGVPDTVKDQSAKEGWIKFGEPDFDIGLTPRRAIQPVPGRLVLFPSYMWHGTIPFHGQARTTIAFDAVPRGT